MRLLFPFLFFSPFCLFGQQMYAISGTVRDAANGETLVGVTVQVVGKKYAIQTNNYGFYSLSLPAQTHEVSFSYVGYKTIVKTIQLTNNQEVNVSLASDEQLLEEVVITQSRADDPVRNLEMSVNKVSMKTIRQMPAFLGEVDVIRSIQNLPGVSSVGEGASGFNVRGGGVDQNLILLDEAPVYNSSHLFGFFSVFNPDVVKDVKLIKGGIPAEYGGRVSSILDVRMKEGNNKKPTLTGGIGTIFSRIAYERPFLQQKGSFIVALRRSYIDVLAKPFLNNDLKNSQFYFYDFTAKANYRLNDKNTFYASGYFGRDIFGADFGFNWGNATTTFRWNKVFSNKLFLNTTLYFSNYDYSLDSDLKKEDNKNSFRWRSTIKNYAVKPDFTYYINDKHTLSFGGQAIYYQFNPGQAVAVSEGVERSIGLPDKFASEQAIYLSNQHRISAKFSMNYGLRFSAYQYLGPNEAVLLAPDNRTTPISRQVVGTQPFIRNKVIQGYQNLEPRIAATIETSPHSSVKLSYNRMAQYLHLLSNTTASSPLDVWTPSSNNIAPQLVDQVALGNFWSWGNKGYEASVEVYFKTLQNQIDYVRNADLLLNPYVEADLLSGKGRAYGSEFFVKKNEGKLTGWVSYTVARTERLVPTLNNGNWFPSRVDRPHNVSVVGILELSRRWNLSTNFSYNAGTPASFPTNKFIWQGIALPHNYYDTRNSYRIPASHRLDLSATLKNRSALFKKGSSEWVFSIYNVYNRRNPFSVYVRQNQYNLSQTEAVQYAVFGSIIPAVTYNFTY